MSNQFTFKKTITNIATVNNIITAISWIDICNKGHKIIFVPPTTPFSAIIETEKFLSEKFIDDETNITKYRYELLGTNVTISGYSIDTYGEMILTLS